MRKVTRTLLATTAVAGLLAGPVVGAGASNNVVEFEVADGTVLSVENEDVADGAVTTVTPEGGGALDFGTTDQTMSGYLPLTRVTDERGGIGAGWTVTVSSGDWARKTTVDDPGTHTISRSNARVALKVDDVSGALVTGLLTGMTVDSFESEETGILDVGANNLGANSGTGYPLITGTTTLSTGTMTYTPWINIKVPANTPSGTYSATVTQTIG